MTLENEHMVQVRLSTAIKRFLMENSHPLPGTRTFILLRYKNHCMEKEHCHLHKVSNSALEKLILSTTSSVPFTSFLNFTVRHFILGSLYVQKNFKGGGH